MLQNACILYQCMFILIFQFCMLIPLTYPAACVGIRRWKNIENSWAMGVSRSYQGHIRAVRPHLFLFINTLWALHRYQCVFAHAQCPEDIRTNFQTHERVELPDQWGPTSSWSIFTSIRIQKCSWLPDKTCNNEIVGHYCDWRACLWPSISWGCAHLLAVDLQ